jgi:hypothetical protein
MFPPLQKTQELPMNAVEGMGARSLMVIPAQKGGSPTTRGEGCSWFGALVPGGGAFHCIPAHPCGVSWHLALTGN